MSPLIDRATKLCGLLLFVASCCAAPVLAAGTIPLALAVQFDSQGNLASGCQVTFFQAGTVSTKQNVFADFSLTQALANPLSCDQAGRLPMFWIADGLIHVRLTDSSGLPIADTTMQVLGPSSGGGGGGGGTIDPTSILQTGYLMPQYGTGLLAGFVRANGLTIGNASSGASERANVDMQALWVYLGQTDPNLVVSTGRSGNCLNDYNASKTIALPDWRGRAIAALDDMGNGAAGRLTSSYFGRTPTTLGCAGGSQAQTLATANLPLYAPAGTITNGGISSSHNAVTGSTMTGGGGFPAGNNGGATLQRPKANQPSPALRRPVQVRSSA
ncbi:hypothetical protein FXB41_28045 [Bradyrhizobium canariense]|uniref:hypothetical protein n=1 Tax=Bradyrhizobium canariense TaxID=255045 RepID=UPI001CA52E5B|nr:hypothetical protein [Bradyrhizobium canariense]MBW5438475.1 hypothetical protein [Bradyrhizobium canariense]